MNRGDYKAVHKRPEYDWFVEPPRAAEQLFDALDFGDDLIWDCCCGKGTILDVAERWGHDTFGSDIVRREGMRHRFQRGNILTQFAKMPTRPGKATSIVSNLPFSYEENIAERIISHVLDAYPIRMAAFILPISFLAGQNRWARLNAPKRPRVSKVLFYTERHSMPPGHLLHEMKAEGGTMDYIALVYLYPFNWRTEAVWVPPGPRFPHERKKGIANAA